MRTFVVCAILVFCCLAIGCGLMGHYTASTESMMPTIGIGDHFVAIEVKSDTLNPINRFDIVVYKPQLSKFNSKIDVDSKFVSRIVGLPNDKLEVKDGKIFINDKLLDEPFEKIAGGKDFSAVTIPENEYFLLGDNRPNSLDSRYWDKSTISRKDIYGKVERIVHKDDWDKGKR
jgi:signal peptidase I